MMREAYVFDGEGAGIAAGEFVRILIEQEEDDEPDAASFRWVVVIDDAMPISFKITIFNLSNKLNTYCVCSSVSRGLECLQCARLEGYPVVCPDDGVLETVQVTLVYTVL